MIYFIIEPFRGAVKIGKAIDPYDRLETLQTGNAGVLTLIGVLDPKRWSDDNESRLHRRFEEQWIRGEWFHMEGGLASFIYKNMMPYDPALVFSSLEDLDLPEDIKSEIMSVSNGSRRNAIRRAIALLDKLKGNPMETEIETKLMERIATEDSMDYLFTQMSREDLEEVLQHTLAFVSQFEGVFDSDWGFTRSAMSNLDEPDCEFPIHHKGSFIEPMQDNESDNWGNRGTLLRYYRDLKEALLRYKLETERDWLRRSPNPD